MAWPKGVPRKSNPFNGGRVNKDIFIDTVRQLVYGETNPKEAAKRCGIAEATWKKYANKFLLGEDIPERFFSKTEDENAESGTD